MLRQALILSSQREYAQTMRSGLLKLDDKMLVNVETDGVRAMQLAPQQYDLILLDAQLDLMDGLQLLQFIKNQSPATKFVVVSDLSEEGARAVAYQNGADFFIERPRTPESLNVALEAIQALFKTGAVTGPLPDDAAAPEVSLVDIIQMHCLSGDSILLMVRSTQQSGDIFIYRGEVYHAQYPGRGGENAFREMTHWDNGRVRIKTIKLTQAPPRTIETPYRLLLGAAAKPEDVVPEVERQGGDLFVVASKTSPDTSALAVIKEAPPREEPEPPLPRIFFPNPEFSPRGSTSLPQINSHWRITLTGELLEGSQVAEPDRCAFITSFIFRKMADVAVALEVDYFNQMTLLGPHLQQVLVADNLGVRHGVFDAPWTNETMRAQYIKWCCEQSL
ncbi:MAG TPA: response regulator [Candidatus Methylacidiphilales bacterium]|jgi:CheY-like chemotaxis protein|nr:response regulator [Candidatus Methylacidiphilales bacterium]